MRTILLIDDEPHNREIYATLLLHVGYRVLEAANGVEGVSQAREPGVDLIIMDLQMPVMNGLDAARALKSDPQTARIPILALSALAMDGDRETAMGSGCDEYLSKPLEPRALLTAIQRWLGPDGASGQD